MDIQDFRTLYQYNSWANHRTLDSCASLTPEQFTRNLGSSFGSVRDTLVHILGAEWIWLERWHGRVPTGLPVAADSPDFESVRRRWTEVERDLTDYIASLTPEDLHRAVQLKTLAGVPHSQPLWPCLQHLANHSTYHRGQIATLLRQLGAKAVSTDLIGFYREQSAKASA
ncbi:MAG TPA: DinB family protein [Candidatus Acidoferrales bacterium]|nr:DinB family protein [Candidatus Acidoferrales bacterium]